MVQWWPRMHGAATIEVEDAVVMVRHGEALDAV